jgi:hypothetical protein
LNISRCLLSLSFFPAHLDTTIETVSACSCCQWH